MSTLVVTFIGDDRAGLVNSVADVVAGCGGNWERSQMAELAGKFAGIVLVTVADQRAGELTRALEALKATLDISVHTAGADALAHEERYVLHLLGTDRPGIVREITDVLAVHGVSIDTLETSTREAPMAGGRLFEIEAVVHATADTDLDAVRANLEAVAAELMVDVDFANSVPG